jgi:hypothetical protein
MSAIEAPPVANIGLPKNPCRNLSTINPGALATSAVGTEKMQNKANDTTYGGFLPIAGISLRGLKRSGPKPYPSLTMS